ncbi:putative FAM91 domain-containing protein [Medicago truncatula]|uniref:FAM91A1-like protein n=4 Tax=Medicago truncatula TaxID=3880 RepID=G7J6Q2_MEDTR|nr:protein FAM91A1 isoform X1 [Medicago truncatula]AES71634.2 FAM91A1-like protein [Medicago truncatula]RHN68931.1 putative FAM91 domain-containing protein [Medicago truncatula]
MQRAPVTVEEQLLLKAIKEECPWENLPKRIQSTLASKEEWHRKIVECCIKKRLQWNSCFARKICKESEYYEDMMRYLRKNLALFPYHLAEYVCRVMRVSPFRYYCDMIFEVMKNEQPYDSIPNFSAADALRLTGIGRNEFIDIMNKCRSKKIMWKLNKSIAKELLPTQPVDFPIESWWGVCLVNFTLEEFKKLSEEEMATIDKICKEEATSFILFDPDVVKGLYRRGLIYFDVPVYPEDRFKVSKLEGFVSNREQSYEDPIEELLYAVFVVSNENASVAELATTLQADLSQLQAAASFVCRLGWATKVIDPSSILQDTSIPGSPRSAISDEDVSLAGHGFDNIHTDNDIQGDASGSGNYGPRSAYTRVAFIVDANITSYLMMGSVSPGLKSHAVTLYEAGKLGYASISDLCKDLSTLEGAKFEGELQEFANHAFSLRCVLECLQSGGVASDVKVEEGFDKMDIASPSNDEPSSLTAEISLAEKSGDSGITEAETNNDDLLSLNLEKSAEASVSYEAVPSDGTGSIILEGDGNDVQDSSKDDNLQNDEKLIVEGSDVGTELVKRKKKYRVDILRCESLASLSPATLDRLFLRDYDIVVSIVPLPQSSVLPGPSGPVHFGPPSYSFMTPWMKLVLYSTVASGPLSVVLMKGQCLRLLPAPLAGCEKALIWSWDGSTVGGLGGKLEGNLVKGSILLHCLNSLLKHSAVLVLPLSKFDLNESGKLITMDIPLPLMNADGSIDPVGKELGICEEESSNLNSLLTDLANKMELCTVGYIRLLRLFNERASDQFSSEEKYDWVPLSVEFGMPLFSPKLCNNICRRVVSSELLQSGSFDEHHRAMQSLKKKIHDIYAEYQATGPAAKVLYQKEQVKESSRQLMNYASGRWNPLVDPSSPISGTSSEHQRLKLANRERCRTEVLSFDGSILRSYALSPVYEAATRPIEEGTQANTIKAESDENDSKEVILPGVNLLFDGAELHPFDIGACLQARQPISLIAEAAAASASLAIK